MSRRPLLLVLRPLGLGDFLTGVPAYRALAAAFPEHERVLAAPATLAPLLAVEGSFDRLVPTEPLAPLAPDVHGAEVAVGLHGRGPASHRVLLAARPRRLLAFRNDEVAETAGMPEWHGDEHETERWCRLLRGHGIPADATNLRLARPAVPPPGRARGATLIHPGAASEARRWPAERFAAVARAELAQGRSVIVTGSRDEIDLARSVASAAGIAPERVCAGTTDLLQLAALVAAAGRVVCGDTGVAHLATACGTPSVVLFGPTSPALWGPPAASGRHRALWAGLCGNPHATRPHDGLLRITVEDVLRELRELDRSVTARPAAASMRDAPREEEAWLLKPRRRSATALR